VSRIIPRNRYNCPVHIPPLQRTPRGLVRVTPRGIQSPKLEATAPSQTALEQHRQRYGRECRWLGLDECVDWKPQPKPAPQPLRWLAPLCWGTLNLIAFALICASLLMLAIALLAM
jgi:hypothetical protein